MKKAIILFICIGLFGSPLIGMQPAIEQKTQLQKLYGQLRKKTRCLWGSRECTWEEIKTARGQLTDLIGVLFSLGFPIAVILYAHKQANIKEKRKREEQQQEYQRQHRQIEDQDEMFSYQARIKRLRKEEWIKAYYQFMKIPSFAQTPQEQQKAEEYLKKRKFIQ